MRIFDKLLGKYKKTDDAETHYFSGVAYQQKRLYKEAEKEYLKAINLNPECHKAYCNLGSLSLKNGRVKDAEKYYKKALQINPKDSIALLDLGCMYFVHYDEDKGLEYFCNAIIADSNIELKVHQVLHFYSYHPNGDIQKLNKLFNKQLRKIYLKNVESENGKYA